MEVGYFDYGYSNYTLYSETTPPCWTPYAYFAAGWPMLMMNLVGFYFIHRLWINPPRALGRELKNLRYLFGTMAVGATVFAWYGWWKVISAQDEIYKTKWNNPGSYEHWRLWPPPLQFSYGLPFYAEKWLVRDRWMAWNDIQFRFWRYLIDVALIFAIIHIWLGYVVRKYGAPGMRAMFDIGVGACALVVLHGIEGAAYLTVVFCANYFLVRELVGTRYLIASVWSLNIAVLVISDVYGGFLPDTSWFSVLPSTMLWHIYFKLSLCRLVSYACDAHWAKLRVRQHYRFHPHQKEGYSAKFFFVYMLYLPLYIAGPILPYNTFLHQWREPTRRDHKRMWLELFGAVLLTHLMTHTLSFVYYNACLENLSIYNELAPWEMIAAAAYLCWFLYSKFYAIWTFFRAWAYLDGIVTVRNVRGFYEPCFTFADFWRLWHVSMHDWIQRYIYQPLGGKKWSLLNIWVIFAFVAVWHDLKHQWAVWAIFNGFFLCLEFTVRYVFKHPVFNDVREWKYYDMLVSFGGAINCFFIVAVNASMTNGINNTIVAAYQAFGQNMLATLLLFPAFIIGSMLGIHVLRFHRIFNK